MNNEQASKDISFTSQMSAEDIRMQAAASQLQVSRDFSMGGSMNGPTAMAHGLSYQQQSAMSRHPLPAATYVSNASFTDPDSQMLDREDNEDGDSVAGVPKPASSRSSANNELEMRQLFNANRHRSLPEIAGELHGNDRGPNSERTRQVFAMLWCVLSTFLVSYCSDMIS
jgi:regulatory factor X, other